MKMKFAFLGVVAITASCLSVASCGTDPTSITFLNFKPEVAKNYDAIVAAYKKETGNTVVVETSASGKYDTTLTSKMGTNDQPAIFQVNGPVGLSKWKDYCSDLTSDTLYTSLSDKTLALKNGSSVLAVPNTVEGYGIIYNSALTDAYFALTDRASTGVDSMDGVKSYATLEKVVTDMTTKIAAGEIGTSTIASSTVKGVFAGTSFKTGEDWRWQTHLFSISLTGEYGNLTSVPSTLDWTYNQNYKKLFDLYLNNSCDSLNQLASIDTGASMAEVATGKAIMVQNGNWGASQILKSDGCVVDSSNLKFLPMYMGDMGTNVTESTQGLAVGTENYLYINSKLSEEKQTYAKEFLHWLYLGNGKSYVAKGTSDGGLGFIPTFTGYTDEYLPSDPLSKQVMNWMSKDGVKSLPWTFNFIPSQNVKDKLGTDLLNYINAGMTDATWTTAVTETKAIWATEAAAL